jgi:PAS domain S-box-containing protein
VASFEAVIDPVSIHDEEFKLIRVNRAFAEAMGTPDARLVGKKCYEVVHGTHEPWENCPHQSVLATGKPAFEEFFEPRLKMDLHVSCSPIIDKKGKLAGSVHVARDVTELKRAAEAVRKAQEKQLREELLHVTRVGKLGELASSIAHEVNQPLTAILSNAQAAQRLLALDNPDIAEVREILGDIVEDDRRAGEVIRKLRSLLRKKELDLERLDVNDLVRDTVELVNTDAIMRSKVVLLALDPQVEPVCGDRVQLQQVLLNLIMNGLDAMVECGPEARELWVRTTREGTDTVRVSVTDCGGGIPEEDMGRLFQHFFTTKPDGMGMGLPICLSIVEAHGGRLSVDNNSDRGVTSWFTLPTCKGPSS